MTAIPGGENLQKLVLAVLIHGVRRLEKDGGLPTSLIEETGTGERTIRRFEHPELKTGVKAARSVARKSTAERVVVTWDGGDVAEADGTRAIYALAQERGQRESLVFVQRYTLEDGAVKVIGNPGFAGANTPLL